MCQLFQVSYSMETQPCGSLAGKQSGPSSEPCGTTYWSCLLCSPERSAAHPSPSIQGNTTDCLVCHTARYLRVVYSWRCDCVIIFWFCRVECFVSAGEDTSLSVVRANAASSLIHSTFFPSPDNIAHRLSTTTTNRLGRYSAKTHVCKTHFSCCRSERSQSIHRHRHQSAGRVSFTDQSGRTAPDTSV